MFPDSNYPSNNFFNNQDHISPQPPLYGNTLNSQIPGYQFPISQTLQPSSADMFSNQQFLMAAGQQLLSNPITAAAIDAYSQSLADKSKGWMGNFKQYFAVDTNYALKKLLLIFLPFFHKVCTFFYLHLFIQLYCLIRIGQSVTIRKMLHLVMSQICPIYIFHQWHLLLMF